MNRHIGIYPGTFDPIHRGHVAFAIATATTSGLDEVIFLPEITPREKTSVLDIDHRIGAIQDAIKNIPKLSVIKLHSTQFTTNDTLPELSSLFPNATFTLLIGSDVVRTFPYRWQNLDILLARVSLSIGMRDDETTDEIVTILSTLQKEYAVVVDYTIIYTDHGHIASSYMRNRSPD